MGNTETETETETATESYCMDMCICVSETLKYATVSEYKHLKGGSHTIYLMVNFTNLTLLDGMNSDMYTIQSQKKEKLLIRHKPTGFHSIYDVASNIQCDFFYKRHCQFFFANNPSVCG